MLLEHDFLFVLVSLISFCLVSQFFRGRELKLQFDQLSILKLLWSQNS